MKRTFRFKLFANKKQATTLDRWRRTCQVLYNAALQERKDAWQKQRISVSWQNQCAQLTEIRATDSDVAALPVHVEQQVFRRLDKAYKAFFRRHKAGEKPGYPRFKSIDRYDSFSLSQRFKVVDDQITIPKLGSIRFHMHRPIVGRILETAIKLCAKGWFVYFACDVGDAPAKVTVRNHVGIDLGLEHFATLSNGRDVENPRYFRKDEEILARRQRSLATKQRGSASRKRAKNLVAQAHEHIANQRMDFLWKLANKIVKEYDLIAYEDLKIRNMLRSSLAKSISDASWARFIHCLCCKAEEAGKTAVAVDPRGTSQRCHLCGIIVHKTLSERRHRCECGTDLHRDHNAALNILALGLSAVVSQPKSLITETKPDEMRDF